MFFDRLTRGGIVILAGVDAAVFGWFAYSTKNDDISSRLTAAVIALGMLVIIWAATFRPDNLRPLFANWLSGLFISAALAAPLLVIAGVAIGNLG